MAVSLPTFDKDTFVSLVNSSVNFFNNAVGRLEFSQNVSGPSQEIIPILDTMTGNFYGFTVTDDLKEMSNVFWINASFETDNSSPITLQLIYQKENDDPYIYAQYTQLSVNPFTFSFFVQPGTYWVQVWVPQNNLLYVDSGSFISVQTAKFGN